ncbi:MAG TPA: LemA family protein [Clostridiales bacterium]|nr:LemA family protein [Clostridiales bacterium]
MKKGFIALIVVVVLVVILVAQVIGVYNGTVELNEDVESKWSQVENNLQRRADLIPNLVATVKGYAKHEEDIFTDIADARSKLSGAGNMGELADANEELSGALSRLLVVVENYPQLKADKNFIQLMDNLESTENRISISRKDYNDAVQTFNTRVKKFPANIFASMFGFERHEYFEADEGSLNVPEVSF